MHDGTAAVLLAYAAVLNPRAVPVPTALQRPGFHFVRQSLEHNEIDYEAVMTSKELLREWSHSEWPEDGFTLTENSEDLVGHIEDHGADLGYGFSILTPVGDRLLGSLYLEPVAPFIDDYAAGSALREALATRDVRVDYWLRDSSSDDLEREVATAAIDWLREAWWFTRPVFATRGAMEHRRRLYAELGFSDLGSMRSLDGLRVWYFHVPPEPRT